MALRGFGSRPQRGGSSVDNVITSRLILFASRGQMNAILVLPAAVRDAPGLYRRTARGAARLGVAREERHPLVGQAGEARRGHAAAPGRRRSRSLGQDQDDIGLTLRPGDAAIQSPTARVSTSTPLVSLLFPCLTPNPPAQGLPSKSPRGRFLLRRAPVAQRPSPAPEGSVYGRSAASVRGDGVRGETRGDVPGQWKRVRRFLASRALVERAMMPNLYPSLLLHLVLLAAHLCA